MSGERPIRRTLAWEDGQTPAARALWRTAMSTASDLELWIRASVSTPNGPHGIGSALTFALACELVVVAATCTPLALIGGFVAYRLTNSDHAVWLVVQLCARFALAFVPVMLVIHVVHQVVVSRAGSRLGKPIGLLIAMRAGLFACGWDLATGPAGIVAPLLLGKFREAKQRASGNSHLFRDATEAWLRSVHDLDETQIEIARRGTFPWMVGLLMMTLVFVGWACLSIF
ncbi:MAG: hypothetical protein NVSMB1_26750 [Polyangiales bacterium]